MKLIKGISVYGDKIPVYGQLSINDTGVRAVDSLNGLEYDADSFVPNQDWRNLTKQELRLLVKQDEKFTNYSKSLYLGEIPQNIKGLFYDLGLEKCKHPDDVYPTFEKNKNLVKNINEELDSFLGDFSSSNDYKFHRITRAMPNRETITCHYIENNFIYIGLHIDQSRPFKIHSAYKSGNRISINLSKETRTLLFTNLTLIQVYNLIGQKTDLSKIKLTPNNITSVFFKHFPNYPVIKMEIKPYQFYIAPTDNFFHDASTYGRKEIDVTIVYTGVFDQLPHRKN
ncbi:hypothetical protein SAMN04489761_2136 [Tenacibaculum sp. MAR_2009_124]|uniref:hypothetical protein n=1 Tax=Tenacibaculum sp. MAR_2009_124 TaxID=1250059 RepID=UPI00089C23E7|nr:hypothetical protein [Tenacibaculum sp. MAR_2009_124]SEB97368.1 hypothetical protein SAMN04489761_2136 [Tenacibaculum sp. MAR_2009_124]